MIALLAFGSLGGWGEELPGNLGAPASSSGQWDSGSHKYTWTESHSNLMDLFSGTDLTGKLGTEYAAIVFTTSGYTSGQEYRIVFGNDVNDKIATIVFYSDGTNKQVVFAKHENTKDIDLSTVKYIKFGGYTSNGSITLDPNSIKLEGHKVTFSATQQDKGTVTATYFDKPFQSGNAVAPGTQLTLTATPNYGELFWTWRQKVGDNYVPSWETDKYTAGFGGSTSTATITQALDMQADFSSIWVKAIQNESDKEYGSVKILHNDQDKGTEYHITPWPGNIKFVAEDGPKGFFVGWYIDASYNMPAGTVTKEDGMTYTSTNKIYCPDIQGNDVTLYAKFERGVQVNANVEPSFLSPTIKIYQRDHTDWVINNGQYVKKATTAVFNVEDIDGYTFKGWYQGETQKTAEKTCDYSNVYADVTLTAKFECNIANNTQKVDLSNYYEPGGNVDITATNWDDKNKTLSVTTKGQWDNVLYLTKINNENRGTGIRIHASGKPYRVIVRFNEKVENETKSLTKDIKIDESTEENDYHTHHYSWKKFGLTDAQISQITDVGVAGLNTTTDETKYTFYVKHFWIDDIADYDHTIACYGEENGNWNSGVYTYSHTNDGVKAAFSNISGDDRNNDTYSIKFKTGDTNTNTNKLNISSSNYNFSSIGLIFDSSVSYNLSIGDKTVSGNGVAVVVPVNGPFIDIINNGTGALSLAKITYTGEAKGINEERSITVDGNTRKYWIYAPEKVKGQQNVPVIFSLHGRQDKGADPDKTDAPKFKDIADTKGVIIVYPQGRNENDQGYPNRTENGKEVAWNSGYAGNNYGWEATGQENADTKFIQALVDELKKNKFYNNTTVDPKRFYLCGFSMGGMMTYACAKVLNGTFAAYGSCGGFPLNEFHLNLATKQPVPFIHLHGDADKVVEIKHLHTIIENLLFRNGCNLKDFTTTDKWEEASYNGSKYNYKRYDFTGVKDVPVTTVTFKDLGHVVHASAPQYLWDFFSNTSDTYKPTTTTTTMKWQWDMTTINSNLSESNVYPYGWKRVTNATPTYLTYGDNRNTGNTGNHNVYNSIQLEKGTYKLHAKANVLKSDNTGITVGIYKVGAEENSGTCIIRRKVVNNSGAASNNLSILYPFVITEDGEYYVKVERGDSQNTCTALAIHTSDYAPDDEDDSENVTTLDKDWQTDGLIVKIDFEDVGTDCDKIGEEKTATKKYEGVDANGKYNYVLFTGTAPEYGDNTPKYDVYNLYCRHDGDIDKNTWGISDVIHHDAIFGNYFQNIPKAQFFDRSAGQNYMRAVLPQKALSPIKDSGAATIGFWVNGRVAVDAGLSYNDASMLYLSGAYHSNQYGTTGGTGKYEKEYQSMFNIRCNGNTNGFLKFFDEKGDSTQMRYFADTMFGDLCDNDINNIGKYYKKNLYLDRNWHYITMVMYNELRNVDMYVDGELTQSRQNIVGSDQDLKAGLETINHIIIGGLNATYTEFTYDPAFAFDDIVIYSRALSAQEIQEIIKAKKYSPTFWDFEKNIANTALLNKDKLKDSYWTYDQVNDVYTLSKQLTTAAELTYDGNRVIPVFRGLKFKATATEQIKIDMKKKRLIVVGKGDDKDAVEMTISNAPAGQYIRYKYDKGGSGWLQDWSTNTHKFIGDIWTSDFKIGITKVEGKTERQTCTCNVHGTINFKSIGSTDKEYADLCFGSVKTITDDKGNTKEEFAPTPKVTVETENFSFTEPELHLFFNGLAANKKFITTNSNGQGLKNLTMTFWSSAPHVAYITSTEGNQPKVKATGVPGSAYIYAELVENNNQYDCNTADKDLYASSNRILARYEIHVPNKVKEYSVKISADETHNDNNHKFKVGEVLKTTDEAVTLTLGGWNYNSNEYFGNTDGYTKKETWKGMPLNKTTNDTNGYQSVYDVSDKSGNYTDDNTYSGLGSYTGGTHAAKSEQLDGADNKGLFYTESVKNNSTAWTLPCRGSYAKVEPTEAGIISVYVLQEGCMERNMTGKDSTYFDSYKVAAYEPYDINIKKVYVADEAGNIIDKVITDTKSKIVSQVWKDDGRARAEYSFFVSSTAYSLLLHERFLNNIVNPGGQDDAVLLLNKWNNPGMTQNIIKFGKGYGIVDKGIVRYTFNVLPGKTYYIFSNDAKMGIAGFNFTKDKQLNFKYDDKINAYTIDEYNPLATDLTPTESVTLDDTKNYSALTKKNVDVTLNRKFYTNYWNAICLPYSINRRQIEKVFGDGTMVVLMNYIDTSKKKVMFIEHANQDIIAGYPYLIFPTKKTDTNKDVHSEISSIKTRATFGEADSPLFGVGTDGKTYLAEPMQSDALVFKGTFTNENLPVGSYVITKSGTLANVPKTGLTINPYRAYIHFNQTTPGAKAIKLASMGFAGFDDMEGETTSIEDLLFNDGIMTRPADVFTVNGQKVRSKAENLYGLPKGVYIVNGKKYVNK